MRNEIKRYSKIAEVENNKAKVILQEVQTALNKGKNVERWVTLGIQEIKHPASLVFCIRIRLRDNLNSSAQHDPAAVPA